MTGRDPGQNSSNGSWRIGRWTVTPSRNRIACNGDERLLEPKVMRVLEVLIEHAGEVVSRREIEDAVWPNAVIGDKTLTRAISELRRAFGDDAGTPAVIETVPRRGYRLIPPVREVDGAPGAAIVVAAGILLATAAGLGLLLSAGPERQTAASPWRQLTSLPGHELTPAPSPSGELIAYARIPEGESATAVFVMPAAGGSELRLTEGPSFAVSPVWSPDGSRIAYLSYDDERCEIRSVAALGGAGQRLASCSLKPRRPNFAPTIDWSPDGTRIAYPDRPADSEGRCILLLDLTSGITLPVTAPGDGGCHDDIDPAFSPDGRRLVFTRVTNFGMADLFLADLDSGTVRRLTEDHRSILGADWLSNDEVMLSSDRSGTYRLWRLGVESGELDWVAVDGLNVKRPRIGDGGTLAYENWLYDMNIWTASRQGGESRKLIESTVWDFHPAPGPDGESLAFVSNRSGNFELWLRDADGSDRQLTRSANRVAGYPAFSPEGEAIAYVQQTGDRLAVAAVDRQGRELFRVPADGNAVAPSWAANGGTIVYGSDESGTWQIYRYDIASGDRVSLTERGGYRGVLAGDGALYFTRHGESGIWIRRAAKPPRQLVFGLDQRHWADWQLLGDALVYPGPDRAETVVADAATGKRLRTIDTPGYNSANARSRQWSADLERVVWAQLDHTEADIILGRVGD